MADLTLDQVGSALRTLGNYRVKRAQTVGGTLGKYLLALGLRETGLHNVEGGARWNAVSQKWVPSYDDTGWTQINRIFHADALSKMVAVRVNTWSPYITDHSPAERGFCPRFEEALQFTVTEMHENIAFAGDHGVPADGSRTRFAVAAHNAGTNGALQGFRAGNLDKYTAMGDYSAWVMRHATIVGQWLATRPNWRP